MFDVPPQIDIIFSSCTCNRIRHTTIDFTHKLQAPIPYGSMVFKGVYRFSKSVINFICSLKYTFPQNFVYMSSCVCLFVCRALCRLPSYLIMYVWSEVDQLRKGEREKLPVTIHFQKGTWRDIERIQIAIEVYIRWLCEGVWISFGAKMQQVCPVRNQSSNAKYLLYILYIGTGSEWKICSTRLGYVHRFKWHTRVCRSVK